MKSDMFEQIGKVMVRRVGSAAIDRPVYSDGPVEKELCQRFRENQDYGRLYDGRKYPSWPHEYHLSPVRHNLLSWYPFDPAGEALEVGAGCGALTGLLCRKLKSVVALEYSYQRALVIAHRHSTFSNLEVVVGGLQDYQDDRRFDYVTVIGVLEYAGTFYGGEKPFESFLKKVHTLLNPNGRLILAIENKIGLKYIAGAPEDHTGRIFESIYDYPFTSRVRTFSRQELATLLRTAGFPQLQWYYPFPDYKMPQVVLSDEVTPGKTDSLWALFRDDTNHFANRTALAERWFAKTLAQAGLLAEFSNSFLVVAKKMAASERIRCVRFSGANCRRKREFRTDLQICVDDGKWIAIRSPAEEGSVNFIREIAKKELLSHDFFKDRAKVEIGRVDGAGLCYSFIPFPSLDELIADAIEEADPGFGKSLLDQYRRFLETLPCQDCIPEQFIREFRLPSKEFTKPMKCLNLGVLDCVPRNIKVGPDSWYILDHEWTFAFPVPLDYVLFRGILTLVVGLQPHIKRGASKDRPVALFAGYGNNREYIPLSWVGILRTLKFTLSQLMFWEGQFQNIVSIDRQRMRFRLGNRPKVLTHVDLCRVRSRRWTMERLMHRLSNLNQQFRLG